MIDVIKKGDRVALVVFKNVGYYDIDSSLTFGETNQLEASGIKLKYVKNLKEYVANKFGLAI